MLDLRRQQLERLVTELSINRLLSFHFILCWIPHFANSSSLNLPFCLSKEIVNPLCLYKFATLIPWSYILLYRADYIIYPITILLGTLALRTAWFYSTRFFKQIRYLLYAFDSRCPFPSIWA